MSGKTVLITGCSDGGLGAALALEFRRKGCRVVATARNMAKMTQMDVEGISKVKLDVTSQESISAAVLEVTKIVDGKLDILINNAGQGLAMPIADLKIDEVRTLYETNVFSYITVTQAFLPLLRASEVGATIANQTSAGGSFGMPFQGAYSSAKAAASVLTETLRRELAPFNIKVVDLKTGVVKTPFFANTANRESAAKLPENSLYAIARKDVEATMSGESYTANAPTATQWAKEVVEDLGKASIPPRLWRGGEAWLIWLLTSLPLPTTVFDRVVAQKSGLAMVSRALQK